MSDPMSHPLPALLAAFRDYTLSQDSAVVAAFVADFDWSAGARVLTPEAVPACRLLDGIAERVAASETPLLETLRSAAATLHWNRTYTADDFGEHFFENYGWVELFGTRGHFTSDRMAGGFLLLGPQVFYPDHSHIAEEIYIPLSDGSLWSKGGSAFAEQPAGGIIHHPSGIDHAMKTGDRPLLAAYLWRGGPLAQKPTIKGQTHE